MPLELDFAERRVLGVLVEKGYTTPEQYPLSLNAIVSGSNQKNCRDPLASLDENSVLDALESLRRKGFMILVRTEGSRVDRWKHKAGEALSLEPKELSILAELLLRGAQTDGELRQRASRMVPTGSLEEVGSLLEKLMSRPEPLVRRVSSPDKKRGAKFDHTLYPASERAREEKTKREESPLSLPQRPPERQAFEAFAVSRQAEPLDGETPPATGAGLAPQSDSLEELKRRVAALEDRVEELEATFVKFLR